MARKKNKGIEIITSLQRTEQSHSAAISIISEDEIGFRTNPIKSHLCVLAFATYWLLNYSFYEQSLTLLPP